jgi:hypothetical protein
LFGKENTGIHHHQYLLECVGSSGPEVSQKMVVPFRLLWIEIRLQFVQNPSLRTEDFSRGWIELGCSGHVDDQPF